MFDKSASYMLTIVASVYGVLAYTIAFALEIWFIFSTESDENKINSNQHNFFETQFTIPITAFIQAAIYFVVVIVSLFLILGVIIRSIVCLLCWIIAIVLAFFPECGLVLYTSLNVWRIETRTGQIELCFYVIRVIMNIFFMICVQNLITQWKSEKQLSSYINCRDAFNIYPHITTTSLRSNKNRNIITSNQYFDNFDTLSVNGLYQYGTIGFNKSYDYNSSSLYKNNPYNTITSEFDTENFKEFLMKKNYLNSINQKHNLYLEPNSLNTQSLDRKAISKIDYNFSPSFKEEVVLKPLNTKPFDYLYRPGSMNNLNFVENFESDENFNNLVNEKKDNRKNFYLNKNNSIRSIKDVAL